MQTFTDLKPRRDPLTTIQEDGIRSVERASHDAAEADTLPPLTETERAVCRAMNLDERAYAREKARLQKGTTAAPPNVEQQQQFGAVAASPVSLTARADGKPPEWVHLVPAGEFSAIDGRGPFRVEHPQAVIAASSAAMPDHLLIDENHSTDKAPITGVAAPARARIIELQGRPDGIWGRPKWTAAGARLMADRAYSGLSPVLAIDQSGVVQRILRASLTNTPAVLGLHQFSRSAAANTPPTLTDTERKICLQMGVSETAFTDEKLRRQGGSPAAPWAQLAGVHSVFMVADRVAAGMTADEQKVYALMGVDPSAVALHEMASPQDIAAVNALSTPERETCRELEIDPLDYVVCKRAAPGGLSGGLNREALENAFIRGKARGMALPELSSLERKYCDFMGINHAGYAAYLRDCRKQAAARARLGAPGEPR